MSTFSADSSGADALYSPLSTDPSSGTHGIAEEDATIVSSTKAAQNAIVDVMTRLNVTAWASGVNYKAKQLALAPAGAYLPGVTSLIQCTTGHTSAGTFAVDAAQWTHLADVNPGFSVANLSGVVGRYIGSVNGNPSSGTFNLGDFANDPSNNVFRQCSVGGTPGTWEVVGGSGGSITGSSTIYTQNGVTIAAGGTQPLTVAVPAGIQSVAVILSNCTTTGTAQFVTMKHWMSNPLQIDDPTYNEQYVPTSSGTTFTPARYNVVPGTSCTLDVNNMGAVPVTCNVTVIGYPVSANDAAPTQLLVPRWAWAGWEDSNLGASPTPVNFQMPITQDMWLLGMGIDLSFSVGNGAVTSYFWTGSGSAGWWRAKDGPPFPTNNSSQGNPSGPAAAGFGTPTHDTNVGVGSMIQDHTLFASTVKNSGPSVAAGANRHVDVKCKVLLKSGDGLWFHMAGGISTTNAGTLDGEMQLAIQYALV